MKKSANLVSFIIGIMFFLVLFFTSFEWVAFNESYYNWHYETYNIMEKTEINQTELMEVTHEMFDFLKGKRDDFIIEAHIAGEYQEIFNEREKLHMDDVQELFVMGYKIRNYSLLGLMILMVFFYIYFKKYFINLLLWLQYIVIGAIGSFSTVGIIVATNFNYFFTLFHEIFFDNDLWILNPNTDVLINIVPLNFFINITLLIGAVFFINGVISIVVIRFIKRRIT
ncbi:TIGR01906 family membrane protein [Natranaerovirga hydrolytica]|nr:TIGR01906 family membrane protein [Natranaerovirga hydrolytica]